jgi:membrane protein DedA with SNARE-associated domain
VPVKAFAGATLLGGLPSGVICSSLGAGLGGGLSAANLGAAMRSPWLWAPVLGLAALSVLPVVYANRRKEA